MKHREEEWMLPKMKKLKGSKDPKHDVEKCCQTYSFLGPS